jgi:hypothetical protein
MNANAIEKHFQPSIFFGLALEYGEIVSEIVIGQSRTMLEYSLASRRHNSRGRRWRAFREAAKK